MRGEDRARAISRNEDSHLVSKLPTAPDDASRLAAFCAPFPHQINLIPWNAHAGADFRAPAEAELDRFARALLEKTRAVVTVPPRAAAP